jgi:hypothetical protein
MRIELIYIESQSIALPLSYNRSDLPEIISSIVDIFNKLGIFTHEK